MRSELTARPKSDPGKLAMAGRLRRETTLPLKWIAARVRQGTSKSANAKLHRWMKADAEPSVPHDHAGEGEMISERENSVNQKSEPMASAKRTKLWVDPFLEGVAATRDLVTQAGD